MFISSSSHDCCLDRGDSNCNMKAEMIESTSRCKAELVSVFGVLGAEHSHTCCSHGCSVRCYMS